MLREERIEHAGIPARVYDPGDARGVVLVGHGAGSSKDAVPMPELCRDYADRTGLAVVCMDAIDHGERRPPDRPVGAPNHWQPTAVQDMVRDWHTIAEHVSSMAPVVAFVGYSMGMIFGAPVVASMPDIKVTVFVVGGLPAVGGIGIPDLHGQLLGAAAGLAHTQVLMLNMTKDTAFPVADVHRFFDAIPGRKKRLMFWEAEHEAVPGEAHRQAVAFLEKHTT